MNHEYRIKFLNESRIIEVKQDRNHEYPKSNDSASTPDPSHIEFNSEYIRIFVPRSKTDVYWQGSYVYISSS